MSWKRGKGTVEVELANLQSYVENIDPDLRDDSDHRRNDREQRFGDMGMRSVLTVTVAYELAGSDNKRGRFNRAFGCAARLKEKEPWRGRY